MDVTSKDFTKEELHSLLLEYNWDDGFNFPKILISNANCDLGTAIMCFHLADGYTYLMDNKNIVVNDSNQEWFEFVDNLYNRIKTKDFKTEEILFEPDLNKVQKFKIRKNIPDLPVELLDGIIVQKK